MNYSLSQLFDHCLAPDTHGDGTGCDNMTCIIIKFDPSAEEAKTGGDPEEGVVVEEVVPEKTLVQQHTDKEEEEEEEAEEKQQQQRQKEEEKEVKDMEGEEIEKGSVAKTEETGASGGATGLKRGAEEAEIGSPSSDEKKLKPSE